MLLARRQSLVGVGPLPGPLGEMQRALREGTEPPIAGHLADAGPGGRAPGPAVALPPARERPVRQCGAPPVGAYPLRFPGGTYAGARVAKGAPPGLPIATYSARSIDGVQSRLAYLQACGIRPPKRVVMEQAQRNARNEAASDESNGSRSAIGQHASAQSFATGRDPLAEWMAQLPRIETGVDAAAEARLSTREQFERVAERARRFCHGASRGVEWWKRPGAVPMWGGTCMGAETWTDHLAWMAPPEEVPVD